MLRLYQSYGVPFALKIIYIKTLEIYLNAIFFLAQKVINLSDCLNGQFVIL